MSDLLKFIHYKQKVISLCRKFFTNHGFSEFTVPIMAKYSAVEPNLYEFTTKWNDLRLVLPTSPEVILKKTIYATKAKKVFAIGYAFRNQEDRSRFHNPEFIMLEWYGEDSNYKQIMQDTWELIKYVTQKLPNHACVLSNNFTVLSLRRLFKKYVGIDWMDILDIEKIRNVCINHGIRVNEVNSWETLFNQLYLNFIEPELGNKPFAIVDFPSKISALAAYSIDNPDIAERYEFYINGQEIANGCTEVRDIERVEKIFKAEIKKHNVNGYSAQFLKISKYLGEHNFAGAGFGFDRFVQLLSGLESLETYYKYFGEY